MKKHSTGSAYIFLNGNYHKDDLKLVTRMYRKQKRKPIIIAVDGGLSFLQKINLRPKFWLTDLDSTPRIKKGFLVYTNIMTYSPIKDKTDGELAFEFCRSLDLADITFFGWYDTADETDHLLGNLMLVHLLGRNRSKVTISYLRSRQNIYYLNNEKKSFTGCKGNRLSTVPISRKINLTLRGTQFPARDLVVTQGQTISLRNYITSSTASVTVKGMAWVIIAG